LNNFLIRLLIVVIVGIGAIVGAGIFYYPSLLSTHQDQAAIDIANDIQQKLVAGVAAPAAPAAPADDPTASGKGKKNKKGKPDAPKPPAPKAKAGLPYAIPVPGRKGMVTSPYLPEEDKYIDVTGFASGSVVKDPYTEKFFLVP